MLLNFAIQLQVPREVENQAAEEDVVVESHEDDLMDEVMVDIGLDGQMGLGEDDFVGAEVMANEEEDDDGKDDNDDDKDGNDEDDEDDGSNDDDNDGNDENGIGVTPLTPIIQDFDQPARPLPQHLLQSQVQRVRKSERIVKLKLSKQIGDKNSVGNSSGKPLELH